MPNQAQVRDHPLPPGPDRRSALRKAGLRVLPTDFAADEWQSIETEAPGMRAELERLLESASD